MAKSKQSDTDVAALREIVSEQSARLDALQETITAQSRQLESALGSIAVLKARLDRTGVPAVHIAMDKDVAKSAVRDDPRGEFYVARGMARPMRLMTGAKIRPLDYGGPDNVCSLIDAGLGLARVN